MGIKFIDVQPVITATFVGGSPCTSEEDARAQIADAITMLGDDFECEVAFAYDARCEHCNAEWLYPKVATNSGCCEADVAAIAKARRS